MFEDFHKYLVLITISQKINCNNRFPQLQICCPRRSSSTLLAPSTNGQSPNQGYANSDGIVFSSLNSQVAQSYPPITLSQNPNSNERPNYAPVIDVSLPSIQAIISDQSVTLEQPTITLDQKQPEMPPPPPPPQRPQLINRPVAAELPNDNVQVPASSNSVLNFVGQSPFNGFAPSTTLLATGTQQQQQQQLPNALVVDAHSPEVSFTFAPLLSFPALASLPPSNEVAEPVPATAPPKPTQMSGMLSSSNKHKTAKHCGVTKFTYSTRVVGGHVTEIGKYWQFGGRNNHEFMTKGDLLKQKKLPKADLINKNIVNIGLIENFFFKNSHQLGQYPWIVTLGYRFPNESTTDALQFFCSGSLVARETIFLPHFPISYSHELCVYFQITRSHIVTSAHCINSYL